MNLQEFQEFFKKYEHDAIPGLDNPRLSICAIGLAGESGEVCEIIKKYLRGQREINLDAITNELGDVLAYVSMIADELDISLEEVAKAVIAKNIERHGDRRING